MPLCLDFDFPENYTHINQALYQFMHAFIVPFLRFLVCSTQLMSQMKWFKKLSTVILIILAHYYDFILGHRAFCTHFIITDDLKKQQRDDHILH